jgi:hypothetical protein
LKKPAQTEWVQAMYALGRGFNKFMIARALDMQFKGQKTSGHAEYAQACHSGKAVASSSSGASSAGSTQ